MALDPIVGGALITGGASLLGGIGNLFGQSNANKTNIKLMREQNAFNAQEAQKARDFNSQEASIARDFNSQEAALNRKFQAQMYQKSLDWRSPANQLKLMQEAGLNPNNFQNGVVSDSAPSGSVASSPAASSLAASGASTPTILNPYASAIDAMTRVASTLTDAKLKEQQGNYIDAQRATEDAMRNGKVELQNSVISLNLATEALTKVQEQRVGKELIKMDYDTQLVQEQISNVRTDTDVKTFQARYQQLKGDEQKKINEKLDERLELELQSIREANRLTAEQRRQVVEVTKGIIIENTFKPFEISLGMAHTSAKISLTDAQRVAVELKTSRPVFWKNVKPLINAYGDVMDIIGKMVGNVKSALSAFPAY